MLKKRPEKTSSLVQLALFMICLAVAGACIAGVHYSLVDLPQQKILSAPVNSGSSCWDACRPLEQKCLADLKCVPWVWPNPIRLECSMKCSICDNMCGYFI